MLRRAPSATHDEFPAPPSSLNATDHLERQAQMTDSATTPPTASPTVSDVNNDDESRVLLGFLQYQRDAVLKIVEGLPEDAWQTPVVPSGWTVAGMLWHLGGVEHH